jgi:hypothetical protein
MDGKRFDAVLRAAAAERSRRGALAALGAAALTGLGMRAAAAEPGAEACQDVRQTCNSRAQCCGGGRLRCDRITKKCNKNRLRRNNRCCSIGDTPCRSDCDCCRGYRCNVGTATCVEGDE